jgi:hypothetical protein
LSEYEPEKKMDRLSIISSALFLTADVFAVASLALPRWIVSDIGGMWIHCKNTIKCLGLLKEVAQWPPRFSAVKISDFK